MTKDDIFARIVEILNQTFDIEPSRITRESRLGEDLDIDSIDAVDLIVQLKPLVGKRLQPEAFKSVRTVQDVVDALSPTAFGLSVHNAIGAMIALTRGDRRNSSAIAAGRATAAAGVVEALSLLDDGARCASLVVYDSPLPDGYAQFEDEPSAHFAWAWRLRRPRAGERALHLDWQSGDAGDAEAPAHLPASLQALWFGLSDAPVLDQQLDGRRCTWSRDV